MKVNDWVGLRPGRHSVRLEKENIDGISVVHNYGHGGSGITVFKVQTKIVSIGVCRFRFELGSNVGTIHYKSKDCSYLVLGGPFGYCLHVNPCIMI